MTERKLTDEEFFCLRGTRSYKQYYYMRKRFEKGACTFCELDRELNKVLYEDKRILVWETPEAFKRDALAEQYLVVPKRHVRAPWELSFEEHRSLAMAFAWLGDNVELVGGMIFARFGDMQRNAGTVPHLHWNVWVPNQTAEVRIPLYKNPDDIELNTQRMSEFTARYCAGEVPK